MRKVRHPFSVFLALPLILLQISSSKCEVRVALAHGRAPLVPASVGLQCTLCFHDRTVTKPCLCLPPHSHTWKHPRGLTFYSWAKKKKLTTLPLADPLRVGGSIPVFHFSSTVKCIAFIFPASQDASKVICQPIA